MNLIINGNKVEFTDTQAKLIRDTLNEDKFLDFFKIQDNDIQDIQDCEITETLDLRIHRFSAKQLFSFLKKGRGKLKKELAFELIGFLCDDYYVKTSMHLYYIRNYFSEDKERIKKMKEGNKEFIDSLYEIYFELKNSLSEYEYIINMITISLIGELILPKLNSFDTIEFFETTVKSTCTFNNYIELLNTEVIDQWFQD